jgi:acyl carrier protein
MEEAAVTTDEIRTKLTTVFQKVLGSTVQLRDDMKPGDLPDWDSVAHVTILMAAEKEFKVKFKAAEIAAAGSVGDLVERIRTKL